MPFLQHPLSPRQIYDQCIDLLILNAGNRKRDHPEKPGKEQSEKHKQPAAN
jgi:hypothetical protein